MRRDSFNTNRRMRWKMIDIHTASRIREREFSSRNSEMRKWNSSSDIGSRFFAGGRFSGSEPFGEDCGGSLGTICSGVLITLNSRLRSKAAPPCALLALTIHVLKLLRD